MKKLFAFNSLVFGFLLALAGCGDSHGNNQGDSAPATAKVTQEPSSTELAQDQEVKYTLDKAWDLYANNTLVPSLANSVKVSADSARSQMNEYKNEQSNKTKHVALICSHLGRIQEALFQIRDARVILHSGKSDENEQNAFRDMNAELLFLCRALAYHGLNETNNLNPSAIDAQETTLESFNRIVWESVAMALKAREMGVSN